MRHSKYGEKFRFWFGSTRFNASCSTHLIRIPSPNSNLLNNKCPCVHFVHISIIVGWLPLIWQLREYRPKVTTDNNNYRQCVSANCVQSIESKCNPQTRDDAQKCQRKIFMHAKKHVCFCILVPGVKRCVKTEISTKTNAWFESMSMMYVVCCVLSALAMAMNEAMSTFGTWFKLTIISTEL